ncbi:MAG: hypothetical protein H7Z40_04430 [Phycisphaerae bacterium]|nr:hypothetical protein [Gemmatimonadaceae bacterium]
MATNSFAISNPRRAAWMTARARNAAKRGGLVASIGVLAVTATLLLLVLLPREVNRSVRARVDALPARIDTTPLLASLTGATDRLRNAEANLQSVRVAYADRVASATANAAGPEQSDDRKDLMMRIARARSAPQVENFRGVGEADFLRNDSPVRVLLDSLNDVNRDREAYAALGGPDARYAAMTARLMTFGQRLLLIAEQRLASNQGRVAVATDVATDSVKAIPIDSFTPRMDTTMLAQGVPFAADSSADREARNTLDSAKVKLQTAEQALKDARETNAIITRERERAEADAPARVPPVAMLVAALVLGLAVGYGVAFYREVKHPRIADAAEVERVADTRVIVHTGPSQSVRDMRQRRQSDDAVPQVVDTASESYQLLHVTLTGFGDTSREVQVVSNDSAIGATVGVNLAVAAARDSRSTLLVDTSAPDAVVSRMLNGAKPKSRKETGSSGRIGEAGALRSPLERVRVGRDLFIDIVSLHGASSAELQVLTHEHDFTVVVRSAFRDLLPDETKVATDVILCVRVGVTSLAWIAEKSAQAREHNQRLRAVLLWSTKAPSIA